MKTLASSAIPLSPKSTFWTLQNVVTATSLQVAVAGVAMAVFTSQTFMAVCFILMGVAIIYLKISKGLSDELIQKIDTEMNKDTQEIKTDTTTVEQLTKKLAEQNRLFETSEKELKEQSNHLGQENLKLQESVKALDEERSKMDLSLKSLEKIKETLETNLKQLKESYKEIGIQFQQFIAAHLEMSKDLGAFQSEEEKLGQLEAALSLLDQHFRGDGAELKEDIQIDINETKQLTKLITEITKGKYDELKQIREMSSQLKESQKILALQIEDLKKAQEKEDQKEKYLTGIQQNLHLVYAGVSEKIKKQKLELSGLQAALSKMRAELEQRKQELASIEQEIEEKQKLLKT